MVTFVPMQFTDEKEERIISESALIFKRLGIKSVNMDDLAARMGMSKKTLYKYVADKGELVRKVFEFHIHHERAQLNAIAAKGLNAIDESFEIMHMVVNMVKDLHPSVLFDIQKYHPELMRDMDEKRGAIVAASVKENLRKGIDEQLYRSDLNIDFISSLYVAAIEGIMSRLAHEPGLVSFQVLYLELFRYHIRGIASAKGLDYLIEKVKNERQANPPI